MKTKSIMFGCALTAALFFNTAHAQDSPLKTQAISYLQANPAQYGLSEYTQLQLKSSRTSLSGETLRFDQTLNGVPVYNGDIAVHFNKNKTITYVAETVYTKSLQNINTTPAVNAQIAFSTAKNAIQPLGDIIHEENKLLVYNIEPGNTKLVYRSIIESSEKPGSWEAIVDAQTGKIISVTDIAEYHNRPDKPKKDKKKEVQKETKATLATGSAYIYNPDPLSVAQVAYGGNYVDNNDATNASLDAARTLVTLTNIENNAGVYKLKSQYAEIKDLQTPSTGLFTQSTPNFLFNRADQGFEAVNVFYHFHKSMEYINVTLGIPCLPTVNGGSVQFDPHGFNGADNSAFYPGGQYLVFGEGGVDDGEDADVILHELGHGIHYWVSGLSSSSSQGLGEGSGDYWAMSYSRSLNQWPSTAAAYNWVFSWDGHNPFWPGRSSNVSALYPGGLVGAIHTDGQIWATCLMRIYNQIGREKTDRIFLEGLGLTNSSANQQTAAVAVRQAAIDMLGSYGFTCADVNTITQELTATGYTLPAYTCVMGTDEVKFNDQFSLYPNPAEDVLFVENKKGAEEAVIITVDGRIVSKTKIKPGTNQINLKGMSKGMYFLKFNHGSLKFIKK